MSNQRQHIFYYVAYNYDTNYIHTAPVEDLTNSTVINTFGTIFKDTEKMRHRPSLNIADNQAVSPLKQYLEKK